MRIIKKIIDCVLLEPTIIYDNRGWFQIPFNVKEINKLGLLFNSVYQLNHSMTAIKGIIRGPNYQRRPYNQTKIVRVIHGSVYSVGIDIDKNSATFGYATGFFLSSTNKYLMYIPNTYAHGFTVLEDGTELEYITDNQYSDIDSESLYYNDKSIINYNTGKPIDWTCDGKVVISNIKSEKNANAPLLKNIIF